MKTEKNSDDCGQTDLSREFDQGDGLLAWLEESSHTANQDAQRDCGDGEDEEQVAKNPWTIIWLEFVWMVGSDCFGAGSDGVGRFCLLSVGIGAH
jgi:hypothetical protein